MRRERPSCSEAIVFVRIVSYGLEHGDFASTSSGVNPTGPQR